MYGAVAFAAVVAVLIMWQAMDASEVVECNKLVIQSKQGFTDFFISQWEKDMCDSHDIIINAPVK